MIMKRLFIISALFWITLCGAAQVVDSIPQKHFETESDSILYELSLSEGAEDVYNIYDTINYEDYDGAIIDYFCDPEFPGGWDSLYTFIRQNLQWPNVPEDWTDTVLVEFIVEVDGSITNPQVKVSQHPEFNEEAIRVIKLMPKWIWDPSRCYNGEVIRAYYQVPVWFTR